MSKFKVGDRVSVKNHHAVGTDSGTIYGIDEYGTVDVIFDNLTTGHSGEVEDGSSNHRFFFADTPPGDRDNTSWLTKVKTKKKSKSAAQTYRGNGNHKWEKVAEYESFGTMRLRVPGGWLYRDLSALAMVFVPVPDVTGHVI